MLYGKKLEGKTEIIEEEEEEKKERTDGKIIRKKERSSNFQYRRHGQSATTIKS